MIRENDDYCAHEASAKTYSKSHGSACRCNEQCTSSNCHGDPIKKAKYEGRCSHHVPGTKQQGEECKSNYECAIYEVTHASGSCDKHSTEARPKLASERDHASGSADLEGLVERRLPKTPYPLFAKE